MARRFIIGRIQARLAGAAVLVCLAALTAAAGSPRLGPGDEVHVSVLNREALSQTYRIRPDGTLSMHVAGEVAAAGRTPSALEALLEELLSESTGLPASVAVNVSRWRPVYALGDVVTPGEIPFREGLTVGRILAASGGLYPRESETASSQLDIRIADEQAQIAVRQTTLVDLHAQRLRLLAESSGAVALASDAEFSTLAGHQADRLIAEQLAILRSRAARDESRAGTAQAQAELAAQEATALARQQTILREQIETSAKALKDLERLLERGLTSTERVRQLRSIYNDENIELMLSASYEARARQTELSLLAAVEEARQNRMEDITAQLAAVMSRIRAEQAEIAASRDMIRTLSAALGSVPVTGPLLPPVFRIRRNTGSGEQILPAALNTEVLPGDLVEIRRGGFAVAEPG